MIETPTHISTHLDGPLHFVSNGRDIASISLEELCGEGVIVDVSDEVGEWDIIKPEHITKKMRVKEGDILIIHTGFHKYSIESKTADEEKYMCRHPGPYLEFAQWALEMKLKWIGVDCGSADHPMNGAIRNLRPDLKQEFEKKIGKPVLEVFPEENYHLMHTKLFPKGLIHVENIGGEIEKLLNKRLFIGCFPMKIKDGEAAPCRVVAFLNR